MYIRLDAIGFIAIPAASLLVGFRLGYRCVSLYMKISISIVYKYVCIYVRIHAGDSYTARTSPLASLPSPPPTFSSGLGSATGSSIYMCIHLYYVIHISIYCVYIYITLYKYVYQTRSLGFTTIPAAYLIVGLGLGYRFVYIPVLPVCIYILRYTHIYILCIHLYYLI